MSAIQISKRSLYWRWAWTGVGAVAALLVLLVADGVLKTRTGVGSVDLQMADSGPQVRFLMDHWQVQADATLAGFLLGFDFLFIALYGAALYFGALVALERLAPFPGRLRRLLHALTMVPLLAACFDVCENGLEMTMLFRGPNEMLAAIAYDASTLKYAAGALALLVNAVAGLSHLRPIKK